MIKTVYLVIGSDKSVRACIRPRLATDEIAFRVRLNFPDNWGCIQAGVLDVKVPDFTPAVGEAFTVAELTQLHDEALRELGTATDDELWGRLVDALYVATHARPFGAVTAEQLTVIPGQPDGIEDGSMDLPDVDLAAHRIREYVSNTGDGLYDVADGKPLYGRDLESVTREVKRQAAELDKLRSALQIADGTTGRRTAERDQARNDRDAALKVIRHAFEAGDDAWRICADALQPTKPVDGTGR